MPLRDHGKKPVVFRGERLLACWLLWASGVGCGLFFLGMVTSHEAGDLVGVEVTAAFFVVCTILSGVLAHKIAHG